MTGSRLLSDEEVRLGAKNFHGVYAARNTVMFIPFWRIRPEALETFLEGEPTEEDREDAEAFDETLAEGGRRRLTGQRIISSRLRASPIGNRPAFA